MIADVVISSRSFHHRSTHRLEPLHDFRVVFPHQEIYMDAAGCNPDLLAHCVAGIHPASARQSHGSRVTRWTFHLASAEDHAGSDHARRIHFLHRTRCKRETQDDRLHRVHAGAGRRHSVHVWSARSIATRHQLPNTTDGLTLSTRLSEMILPSKIQMSVHTNDPSMSCQGKYTLNSLSA